MDENPEQPLSPLTKASWSVLGPVISHVMDVSTMDMPPPPPIPQLLPLPQFIPVTLPPLAFPPIPAPRIPLPQRRFLGVRPMTRSHSTGEKEYCHGRKWFEDDYSVKHNIKGPHPFLQWFLRTTIGSHITPAY